MNVLNKFSSYITIFLCLGLQFFINIQYIYIIEQTQYFEQGFPVVSCTKRQCYLQYIVARMCYINFPVTLRFFYILACNFPLTYTRTVYILQLAWNVFRVQYFKGFSVVSCTKRKCYQYNYITRARCSLPVM